VIPLTKQIEIVKDIIEDALWYDGGIYPIFDSTDNMSYTKSGTRLGNYSGHKNWLKLVSTYAYNGFTITLNPTDEDAIVINAPVDEEIIVDYFSHAAAGSTQSEIATALQASAYITTATAANGSTIVLADSSSAELLIGKFFVKRKEAGLPSREIHEIELYNIKCESDTEEHAKIMINNIRLLNTSTSPFSFVYSSAGDPFFVRFGAAGDDKQNEQNVENIITISGDVRWML